MHTYAFLAQKGLSPRDVEAALQTLGVEHKGVQIFHYTRPRVVMVMTEVELEPRIVDDIREIIAGMNGMDPPVPKV